MKTVIAGSRDLNLTVDELNDIIKESKINITEVVSGTARGIDKLGEQWAEENNIPIIKYPADWNKYGKAAGFIRNEQMAKYCEAALIVWDGKSPGTKHMYDMANRYNKIVFLKIMEK